jgi:hypothetical protein
LDGLQSMISGGLGRHASEVSTLRRLAAAGGIPWSVLVPTRDDRLQEEQPQKPTPQATILPPSSNREWRDYRPDTTDDLTNTDAADWDPNQVAERFGVPVEVVVRKYRSYKLTLQLAGKDRDWNADIDALALKKGAFTERMAERAKTDFNQAAWNRVLLALHMEPAIGRQ